MSRATNLPRVYVPDPIPAHGRLSLTPRQAHHIAHVLRLEAGDRLIVFDGRGHECPAAIQASSRHGVMLDVGEARPVSRESPLRVMLAQGISSGERMDYTIQKAVELGVAAIQPIATERSVVRLDPPRAAKRLAHWRAVSIAACEQCGRNSVPEVLPVVPLARWLGAARECGLGLILTPAAQDTLRALETPQRPIVLLAGPEGGLSPREQADAMGAGFKAVRLGPRVLRTETAALAALAAMQMLWGDF